MRYYLFVLFTFIFSASYSQEKITLSGVIKDAGTGEYLPGVVIKNEDNGTVSNADGSFIITLSKGDKLQITAIGYKDKVITLHENRNNLTIKLDRKYYTFNDAEITAQKFDLEELFKNVLKNIKSNYLPSNNVLKGSLHIAFAFVSDTLVDARQPLFMYNGKSKWFNYRFFHSEEDTICGKLSTADTINRVSYMPHIIEMYEENMTSKLRHGFAQLRHKPYILSTFNKGDEKFYDVIFVNTGPVVHYTGVLQIIGSIENNTQKGISLIEYQISAKNFAVANINFMVVEANDSERAMIDTLKYRDAIQNALNQVVAQNRKILISTEHYEVYSGKYYLQHTLWYNTLIHSFGDEKNTKDFTYINEYTIDSVGAKLPASALQFLVDGLISKVTGKASILYH